MSGLEGAEIRVLVARIGDDGKGGRVLMWQRSESISAKRLRQLGLSRPEYHAMCVTRTVLIRKLREREIEIGRLHHEIVHALLHGTLVSNRMGA